MLNISTLILLDQYITVVEKIMDLEKMSLHKLYK